MKIWLATIGAHSATQLFHLLWVKSTRHLLRVESNRHLLWVKSDRHLLWVKSNRHLLKVESKTYFLRVESRRHLVSDTWSVPYRLSSAAPPPPKPHPTHPPPYYKNCKFNVDEPVWPNGSIRFGSPFSSRVVVDGRCLVTLPTHLTKHQNVSHSCLP